MALISSPVPNLIGGVSQQPAALRFPGQAESQENAMSTVVEGLTKRPPTEHVARVYSGDAGAVIAHTINRDTTERYVVTLGDQSVLGDNTVRVYDIAGNVKDIKDKYGSASSAGGAADSADFTYLNCDDPTQDLKVLTVNDYTFIVNRKITPAMTADTTTDPGNQALVTIVQGNYSTKYEVEVTYGGSFRKVIKETDSTASDIQTSTIASDLKTALETGSATGCTISGSLGNLDSAAGWSLDVSGSTVLVKRTTASEDFDISLEDSVGNGNSTLVKDTAQLFTDLPLVAPHGFITKIAGDPETGIDDYYVKFVADSGSGFENGTWEETVKPGEVHKIDPTTMPHLLLRTADGNFQFTPADGHTYDIGGTDYTVPEWSTRQAGDTTTNPDPGFIGEPINDIFFFKNRLGFLAGEKVVMSEAGQFFNFFRTTITSLLDSAVIDVTAAHTKVSILRHAIPYVEVLVLFSDQTQFVLRSEGLLTPKTVSITPSTEFEADRYVAPEANGDSIFFATTRGSYAGIREYRDVSSQRLSFEATEVSATVPTYISGSISKMASSAKEDVLVIQASGSTSTLWIYKFFNNGGQRVQSSWFKFTFGSDANIKNVDFIDSTLYLLIQRAEGLFLESMDFAPGQADTDSTFRIALDRRITEAQCTSRVYSEATDKTTITLPYNIASGASMQVSSRAVTGANDPFQLAPSRIDEDFGASIGGSGWVQSPEGTSTASLSYSDDGTLGPLGEGKAYLWTPSKAALNYLYIQFAAGHLPTLTDEEYYTFSFYVKNKDAVNTQLVFWDATDPTRETQARSHIVWSGSTGSLDSSITNASGDDSSFSLVDVGNGWYRVSGTIKMETDHGTTVKAEIQPEAGYSSGGKGSVYLWGPQVVNNDNPEPYGHEPGVLHTVTSTTTNTLVVSGDLATRPLWIGEKFTKKYTFTKIHLQQPSQRGGMAAVLSGRYQLRNGTLLFEDSGYFKVKVTPKYQSAYEYPFTARVLGSGNNIIGSPSIEDGVFKFPLMGKHDELTVEVENDSPLPSRLLGAEWEASYNPRSTRMG